MAKRLSKHTKRRIMRIHLALCGCVNRSQRRAYIRKYVGFGRYRELFGKEA